MHSPLRSAHDAPQPVELTHRDLVALSAPKAEGRLPAKHREVARLRAQGYAGVHIAQAVGCVPRTVSHIARSPAFQKQFSIYMHQRDQAAIDFVVRLRLLAEKALDLLSYRLRTEGQTMPIGELRKVVVDLLDRAGYAPTRKRQAIGVRARLLVHGTPEVVKGAISGQD